MRDNPRRQGSARGMRAKIRKQLRATVTHCAICGKPLDWDEPFNNGKNPAYVELDEIVPLAHWDKSLRMRAATNIDNIQATHRLCNQRKGKKLGYTIQSKQTNQTSLRTSQEW